MAEEDEQISSDDQEEDLTDFHTYVPKRSYRTVPDSYSYRLTHDISLDNFQSEDLFDPENDLTIQGDWGGIIVNKPAQNEVKIIRQRHNSNSSDKCLKEEMIELSLSDTNVLITERLSSEQLDNEHSDNTTTALLNIIEAETSRRKCGTPKSDDPDSSRRALRQKRKTKRKGRKLPQMPPAKPGNLQTELLQANRTTTNSNSSALSSTPSPENNASLSSVPPSPSDNSTLPNTPVEPYALKLERPTRLEFNTTSTHYTPFLSNTNMLLQEDSSPEERQRRRLRLKMETKTKDGDAEEKSEDEDKPCFMPATLVINGEIKQQTHIAVFRFLPRHDDELPLEVNDPVFVEVKCDDLWYEGMNLKTGDEGCFPSRYVRDFMADTDSVLGFRGRKVHINRYNAKFLGSVEVAFHKGNDVLCRAVQKVVTARRLTLAINPPTVCVLEISDIGVKMIDKTKPLKPKEKKDSVLKKVEKLLGSKQNKGHNYFFSLKNVSFCGYHPSSNRYFAFITKHPSDGRYACHVFLMEDGLSAKPLAEAMGAAFKRFYSEFLDFTNPTEDIYME